MAPKLYHNFGNRVKAQTDRSSAGSYRWSVGCVAGARRWMAGNISTCADFVVY